MAENINFPQTEPEEDNNVDENINMRPYPTESAGEEAIDYVPSNPSTTPAIPVRPAFPTGTGNRPNYPTTIIPIPIYPSWNYPQTPAINYGKVRFLNASTNSFPVNISIDNTPYAVNLRFGTISDYDMVSDGFHVVTVQRATGLRTTLLQQTLPFSANEKTTIVLTDSQSGNLELVKVSDTGCSTLPFNYGCYRFANMSYYGSSYNLTLYNNGPVFRNVAFGQITSYKQAAAGSYELTLTNSAGYTPIAELPMIVVGAWSSPSSAMNPILSFQVQIQAGKNYTSYAIGNTWSDNSLRIITVED